MKLHDSILRLVCGVRPDKLAQRNIMALQVYIDDSGSDPQSHIFVLAGLIAPAEAWSEFSYEWSEALERSPKLAYFKMSEAASMRGQFGAWKGWNRELINERLVELSIIIKKYSTAQVSACISHSDFEETIKNLPTFGSNRTVKHNHPYNTLWHYLVSHMWLECIKLNISEPVDYIFDDQIGFTADAIHTWEIMKRQLLNVMAPNHLGFIGSPPVFRDDKDFLPIQAADMIAWSNRRVLEGRDVDKKLPLSAKNNLISIPAAHLDITKSHLKDQYVKYVQIAAAAAKDNPKLTAVFPYS